MGPGNKRFKQQLAGCMTGNMAMIRPGVILCNRELLGREEVTVLQESEKESTSDGDPAEKPDGDDEPGAGRMQK
ncbi:MAG: hypothetical protein Q9181_001407 [Wetmoreana brouardii]